MNNELSGPFECYSCGEMWKASYAPGHECPECEGNNVGDIKPPKHAFESDAINAKVGSGQHCGMTSTPTNLDSAEEYSAKFVAGIKKAMDATGGQIGLSSIEYTYKEAYRSGLAQGRRECEELKKDRSDLIVLVLRAKESTCCEPGLCMSFQWNEKAEEVLDRIKGGCGE